MTFGTAFGAVAPAARSAGCRPRNVCHGRRIGSGGWRADAPKPSRPGFQKWLFYLAESLKVGARRWKTGFVREFRNSGRGCPEMQGQSAGPSGQNGEERETSHRYLLPHCSAPYRSARSVAVTRFGNCWRRGLRVDSRQAALATSIRSIKNHETESWSTQS